MFAATFFSCVSGVLSTQSLLYAVGLGAGSVPVAAAVNWVLKDGLGQLGGVIAAASINSRFDSEPKRWRFLSGLAQDASTLLELLTPLAPGAFLPLAAVANVGKNVSWLAASATRAGIHLSLASRSNLADVTAKSGSQATVAATAGTFLGAALSPLIGTDPQHILAMFAFCSVAHLASLHWALRGVVLLSCSPQRFALATAPVLGAMPLLNASVVGTQPASVRPRTLTPAQVAAIEDVLPFLPAATRTAEDERRAASLEACSMISVGPPIDGWSSHQLLEFARASDSRHSKYVVAVLHRSSAAPAISSAAGSGASFRRQKPAVGLLLLHDASARDSLYGFLHALFVARGLLARGGHFPHAAAGTDGMAKLSTAAEDTVLVSQGRTFVREVGEQSVRELEAAGWWVKQPLLERRFDRRLWLSEEPTAVSMGAAARLD